MDNGEVIQGLNEDWTLGGAKATEWMAGFMAFMVAQELIFHGPAPRYMPVLLAIWISATFTMAALRSRYEDEERGLRNQAMVAMGLPPPGLPTPAALQPFWSATPIKALKPECELLQLGIDPIFQLPPDETQDEAATGFPFQRPMVGMASEKKVESKSEASAANATGKKADEKVKV